MCLSSNFEDFQPKCRSSLTIKAFFVRFSGLNPAKPLPNSITLLYLPRVNGAELLVDGSKIRPYTSAFLTLHRVVNVKSKKGEAIFGSRSQVFATGGIRFEVFMRDERVLDGILRKDDEEWKLECECGLDSGVFGCGGRKAEADVCVAVEGRVALSDRVEMVSKRRKKKNPRIGGFGRLEVIPEESEESEHESDSGCWSECECSGSDGGDSGEVCGPDYKMDLDLDLEGVKWAVDVGIWVMCLGVGYLFSKASARKLRRLL